jgi:hypothetical protein
MVFPFHRHTTRTAERSSQVIALLLIRAFCCLIYARARHTCAPLSADPPDVQRTVPALPTRAPGRRSEASYSHLGFKFGTPASLERISPARQAQSPPASASVRCSMLKLENVSTVSSLRQSLAHNVSKILAAGFGRFNNSPKIVPSHGDQFHISLGANRSVSTCFGQEPNLPEVIARMKNR